MNIVERISTLLRATVLASCFVMLLVPTLASAVTIGTYEVVANNAQMSQAGLANGAVDSELVRTNEGKWFVDQYYGGGDFRVSQLTGGLDATYSPFTTVDWTKWVCENPGGYCRNTSDTTNILFTNGFGSTPVYRLWIMYMWDLGAGEYLGFVHEENQYSDQYKISLARSVNYGQNWTYLGNIVMPYDVNMNVGGIGVLGASEGGVQYFYITYIDSNASTRGNWHLTVARAPQSEVIAAARNGTVTTWNKFNGGTCSGANWASNPATYGEQAVLIPASFNDGYAPGSHSQAIHSTTSGKYYFGARMSDGSSVLLQSDCIWGSQTLVGGVFWAPPASYDLDRQSLVSNGSNVMVSETGSSFYYYATMRNRSTQEEIMLRSVISVP